MKALLIIFGTVFLLSSCSQGETFLLIQQDLNISQINVTNTTLVTLVRQDCSENQIIKWNGTHWNCATDSGGSGGSGSINILSPTETVINYSSDDIDTIVDVYSNFNVTAKVSYSGDLISNITIDNSTSVETLIFNYSGDQLTNIQYN